MAISCGNLLICNLVPGDRHSPCGLRDDRETCETLRMGYTLSHSTTFQGHVATLCNMPLHFIIG